MIFKDHFSRHASSYAQYRPTYPPELFTYLSSLCDKHQLAWDCGTGNGQCAIQLVNHYDRVFASDPSAQQIGNAITHEKITYKVEPAERSSLLPMSADLIVVAQALHWFDQEKFFDEVERVLKSKGIIAVISYVNPVVSNEIDALADRLHDITLDGYWLPENRLVFDKYKDIAFPFKKVPAPAFRIAKKLSREEYLGHLGTWSAVQRYIARNGTSPLAEIESEIQKFWSPNELKTVVWNLNLVTGRKSTWNRGGRG